jgi:uncharacterized protein with von Willebrand factor type A (vWA) domain
MYPFTSLPENLAAFCDLLRRDRGFRIGPGELHDAARALDVVGIASQNDVRNALRPILSATLAETAVFDQAFSAFFLHRTLGDQSASVASSEGEPGTDSEGRDGDGSDRSRRTSSDTVVDDLESGGGPMTPLESKDGDRDEAVLFAPASYSPLAIDDVVGAVLPAGEARWREAARSLVRRLHAGLSRRWRPVSRGRRFDPRRMLRASLQTGGEPITPRWLRRPRRPPRFVLLVDGSRSMSDHAQTALEMAVAMASVTALIEVFTFSTALQRATADVRRAAAGESCRLDGRHHTWAGGTDIGGCFRDFLRRFGPSLLGRNTIVMISSDGLDVGEPGTLFDAMRELHRRSASIVWLNPLLESPGYEPRAGGMRIARPFVDTFASANDAAAFARLSRLVRVRA